MFKCYNITKLCLNVITKLFLSVITKLFFKNISLPSLNHLYYLFIFSFIYSC